MLACVMQFTRQRDRRWDAVAILGSGFRLHGDSYPDAFESPKEVNCLGEVKRLAVDLKR